MLHNLPKELKDKIYMYSIPSIEKMYPHFYRELQERLQEIKTLSYILKKEKRIVNILQRNKAKIKCLYYKRIVYKWNKSTEN